MILQGENITLRPIQKDDYEVFYTWRNNQEYIEQTKSIRFPKHELLEKKWVESVVLDTSNRNIYYVIELSDSNEIIGFVALSGIDWISRNCYFGIAIPNEKNQGKGYSKEAMNELFNYAFDKLGLKKILLEVVSINEKAIKAYEKFGFIQEGLLKENYFLNGTYHDVYIFSYFNK